jgi:protein TonB
MRRRKPKFYLLSFAIHAFLLFAIYEIGCPRSIVRSEPLGITVQVMGKISQPVPAKASRNPAKNAAKVIRSVSAPGPKLGNVETTTTVLAGSAVVGISNGAEASAKERYLYELRLLLDARKEYPALAKTLRQEGSVEVGFVLRPDGKIDEAGIVAPSTHASLNHAALQLVEAVGKFKPLPTELQKIVGWRVSVPIEYRLR